MSTIGIPTKAMEIGITTKATDRDRGRGRIQDRGRSHISKSIIIPDDSREFPRHSADVAMSADILYLDMPGTAG
jgi:hypothetical protein